MGQLRDRMEADLRLAGYSPSTRKIYLGYARLFAKYHMRSPAETSAITAKPATRRHLKTGHFGRAGTEVIYCAVDALGKFAA